ncbi:MAG: hypothetical protein NVS9B10_05410 [Nevskia sp.]
MTVYAIFESVVIALVVGASAHQVFRKLAPATYRAAQAWLAARLGIKLVQSVVAEKACDSGCGTCATGCGSSAAAVPPGASREQPLHFKPGKT